MSQNQPAVGKVPFFGVTDSVHIAYRKHKNIDPVRPHVHNALEIYFTLTDLPEVLLGDLVATVPAGSLILIPAYMVHQLYHEPDPIYERYVLTIDPVWLGNALRSCPSPLPCLDPESTAAIIPLSAEDQQLLIARLQDMLAIQPQFTPEYYASFFLLYHHLQEIALNSYVGNPGFSASTSKSQDTANQIIRFIRENLTQNLHVADIADHFYLNRDYLERLFKQETHLTIGQYIALQKVSLAQQYFRRGLTVSQVGEQLGFCNYAHFSRFFKKMTGLTPSQYARSM